VGVLDAGWGLEAVEGEKKGEKKIYPRSHLGPPSFFVSKCKRTMAQGWDLKRGQREGEVVGQGCHLGWFAKREKRKEEKGKKRSGWPKFI
jgi:hypothetical protein